MTTYNLQGAAYLTLLGRAKFKATGTRVKNQFARTVDAPEDVAVVFLSLDGGFKTYRRDGVENGRGCKPYELEALL